MKKILVLAQLAISILMFSSCVEGEDSGNCMISTKGHYLDAYLSLSFDAAGQGIYHDGKRDIFANDNTSWSIVGVPSWLKFSPSSGKGYVTVTITAEENLDISKRVAVLTLKSDVKDYPYFEEFTVQQAGAEPYVTASKETVTCSASAFTETIAIQSNCEWTVYTFYSWLTVSKVDEKNLSISVAENQTGSSRSATIYLEYDDKTLKTINVSQMAANVTSSLSDVDFSVRGDTKTVDIEADASWTVDASDVASWLSVTPTEGKAGKATLTLTALPNTSASTRSGYVYIKVGTTKKVSLYVKQKGLTVEADVSSVSFESTVESKQITLTSDIDWSIVSCPDWLEVSPTQGTAFSEHVLTIKSTDNPNTTSRSGTIEIGKEGFSGNEKISVYQKGKTFSSLGSDMTFSVEASTQTLSINTDGVWSAMSTVSWISLSPTSGAGNGEIAVSVESNPDKDDRTGEICVTVGATTKRLTVTQKGRFIDISCDNVLTKSTPTTVSLSLTYNDDWEAKSEVSWMTVTPSNGTGNAELSVAVSDNPSIYGRQGNINFSTSVETKVLSFTQPGRTLTVDCTELSFNPVGGSSNILVTTDGKFKADSSVDWISLSVENNVVYVTIAANTTDNKREGKIIISLTDLQNGEILVRTIKVAQHFPMVNVGYDDFEEDENWNL